MNISLNDHIKRITGIAEEWLQPDNFHLKEAIDRTVNEGLFSFEDIKHQLLVLRDNIRSGQIRRWAEESLNDEAFPVNKKVLCLHAGNLPLVGFQTALGVLLAGGRYHGKLSKKDPWLLQTFLKAMQEGGYAENIEYSTDLNLFSGLEADTVIFAGSEQSIEPVKQRINELNAAKNIAGYLIRTAKFSVAYIDKWTEETMKDLAEAILRYGGQGCRSVAVVVAPEPLDRIKCGFTDHMELYWMQNPPHAKPSPALEYRFAYNKAVGRSQAWLDHMLIEESDEMPDMDHKVHWIAGDEKKVKALKKKFGDTVQSVYTTGSAIEDLQTDLLSLAQRPPLWWKPDGKDLLSFLSS